MKQITEVNFNGVEILHQDGDDFAIETRADVEANLKRNHMLREYTDGYNQSRDMRHIASVPVVVVEEWNRIHGVDVLAKDNRKLLKRLLNDRDNYMFRTCPGTF